MRFLKPAVGEEDIGSVKPELVSTGEVLLRVMQEDNRSVQNLIKGDLDSKSSGKGFLFGGLAIVGLLAAGPVLFSLYNKLKDWGSDETKEVDDLIGDVDEAEQSGLNEAGIANDEKETKSFVKKTFGDLTGKPKEAPEKVKSGVQKAAQVSTAKGLATPSAEVDAALKAVAAKTEIDYQTLYALAGTESSFRADAKASTSSATGLGQFLDSTWDYLTQKRFPQLGYTREDRTDPYKSATVAALYLTDIKASLTKALGREPTIGDKYLAYFMGPSGAIRFIRALKKNPAAIAAQLFPSAAKANRNLFFKGRKALTLQETYDKITGKIQKYYTAAIERTDDSETVAAVAAPVSSSSGSTKEGGHGRDEAPPAKPARVVPATPASRPPTEVIAKQGEAKGKASAAPMTLTPTQPRPRPVAPEEETVTQAEPNSDPTFLPESRTKRLGGQDFIRTRSGLLLSVPS